MGLNLVFWNLFAPMLPGMCWSVAQEENYVYLGYESGHFVLFDQRNYAKQVKFTAFVLLI